MHKDYSCPGATFAFCSHGEKLPWQGGLPTVVQRLTRLSKLPQGNEKLMRTVTGVRPCTETKLTLVLQMLQVVIFPIVHTTSITSL